MIKNGNGLFVLGNKDTINFIPKVYSDEGVPEEDWPKYTLRPMTIEEKDQLDKKEEINERAIYGKEIAYRCIVNWENKKDLKGNLIEFSDKNKRHFLNSYEINEIAMCIYELSGLYRSDDSNEGRVQVEDSPEA